MGDLACRFVTVPPPRGFATQRTLYRCLTHERFWFDPTIDCRKRGTQEPPTDEWLTPQ